MPKSDSWPALPWVVRLSPFPTGLPLTCATDADQVSRFSCMMFPDVRGVSDCAGSPGGFVLASPCVWSSPYAIGSTPWICSFTAQYPACPCPYLRFAFSLSTDGARLGVRMGHYSFPVRLFHSLHHAGLPRRTACPTSKSQVIQSDSRRWQSWLLTACLEIRRIESFREQIFELIGFGFAVQIDQRHWHVAAELPQDLPARATRRSEIVGEPRGCAGVSNQPQQFFG